MSGIMVYCVMVVNSLLEQCSTQWCVVQCSTQWCIVQCSTHWFDYILFSRTHKRKITGDGDKGAKKSKKGVSHKALPKSKGLMKQRAKNKRKRK